MSNETVYRPIEESDLCAVLAIEQRVLPFGWNLNTFRPCLFNDAYECWKLESRDRLIGYCVLYFVGSTAQLLNICVDQPYQGQGYGKDFLSFAIERCRERKTRELLLEVRVSNLVARRLYDTMGFQKLYRRKDYYECNQGKEHADVFALEIV